jgi:hypothetical protein
VWHTSQLTKARSLARELEISFLCACAENSRTPVGVTARSFLQKVARRFLFPSAPVSSRQLPSVPVSSRQFPSVPVSSRQFPSDPVSSRQLPSAPVSSRQFPSVPVSSGQFPSVPASSSQFPSAPVSSRQFPPAPASSCQFPSVPASSRQLPELWPWQICSWCLFLLECSSAAEHSSAAEPANPQLVFVCLRTGWLPRLTLHWCSCCSRSNLVGHLSRLTRVSLDKMMNLPDSLAPTNQSDCSWSSRSTNTRRALARPVASLGN